LLLRIEFDCDADIINVPPYVIEHKDSFRAKFLKWIRNKNNDPHRHKTHTTKTGKKYTVVCYRADAFVEWLNQKIIHDADEKASIIATRIDKYDEDIPAIFF